MNIGEAQGGSRKPRLIVVYGEGSAGAGELLRSLHAEFDLLMVVEKSSHTNAVAQILGAAGPNIPLSAWRERLPELRAWRPDGITTFTELLRETSALAAALDLPYHSAETARLLTDKSAQRGRLRARGLDATRSVELRHVDELPEAVAEVGLPAVLKPSTGRGSHNTHRLDDHSSAVRTGAECLATGDVPYVLEEFLEGVERPGFGDYVSVETVLLPEGAHHLAVTGKFPLVPPFRECGQFWPSGLDEEDEREVLALTTTVLGALGVAHGITHTEWKLTADGPRLIEVNGRLGGWIAELTERATGEDLLALAARVACGASETVEYRGTDVYFQLYNVPPLGSTELLDVTGAAAVRAAPGVQRYLSLLAPGPLAGGVVTERLDMTGGRASSHAEVHRLLDAALQDLVFTFADAGGARSEMPACLLPSWGRAAPVGT